MAAPSGAVSPATSTRLREGLMNSWLRSCFLVVLASAAHGQQQQFGPINGTSPTPSPYQLDNVRGEFVNFETQLIKPIVVLENGNVAVANEPNGTVEVYSADLGTEIATVHVGQGICALVERQTSGANELWVSVRHQQAVMVIDEGSWDVEALLRPNLPQGANDDDLGYGVADHPGQIVFDRDQSHAYVAAFNHDKVVVYNASTKAQDGTPISLTRAFRGHDTDLNTPYSMVVVEGTGSAPDMLYVVSHISGNRTIAEVDQNGFATDFIPPNGKEFVTELPRSRPGLTDLDLPDYDVMVVDLNQRAVVNAFSGIGAINFNVAHSSGRLLVTNLHLRNAEFHQEGAWENGKVGINRVTSINTTNGTTTFVALDDLKADAVAQPTDIVVDGSMAYVAGYGSGRIATLDLNGTPSYDDWFATGSGPRGLAVNNSGHLYVYCRGDHTVRRYVFGGQSPTETVLDLFDPTPTNIRVGRQEFIKSDTVSGNDSTSCNTCHVDGRKDGLAWDLSKGFAPDVFQDRKGIMVTMDLRSLEEAAPLPLAG